MTKMFTAGAGYSLDRTRERRSSLPSSRMRRPVVPAVVLALALVVVACASAAPRQATALRLVPFASGLSSPIQVTRPAARVA